jgi:hypothetical protein
LIRSVSHVRLVHLAHELRLLDAELVVADVEEEALGVEHRPHRAVEHVDLAVGEQLAQRGHLSPVSFPRHVAAKRQPVTAQHSRNGPAF